MTVTDEASAYRKSVLGVLVTRSAALQPATAYGALFTVAGGKVLITSLVGEVVVATPATTNTVKVVGTPTSGTAVDWCTATSTASKEIGSLITLPGVQASALAVNNAGGGNPISPTGQIAQIGTVGITTSGTAATGTIKWALTYVPIDQGATVVAA